MRHTFRLTRTAAFAAAAIAALGLAFGVQPVAAKKNPCLIGLKNDAGTVLSGTIKCNDCDPTCDHDNTATPNQACTFRVQACPDLPGCEGKTLKSAKVKPASLGITTGAGSACGSVVDVVVKLKKHGKKEKPGKKKLIAMAKTSGKPTETDNDVVTLECDPQPAATCPTTTTTTTTNTTTTTVGCGDGSIDNGEQCDDSVIPSGCGAGQLCLPPGDPNACTCLTCGASTGTVDVVTSTAVSPACGGVGASSTAPNTGTVTVSDNSMLTLGAGCLYVGGGNSTVPGGPTPDGSTSTMDVAFACSDSNSTLLVQAHAGDLHSCTKGAGPGKACINDLHNFPAMALPACTTDADCRVCNAGPNAGHICAADTDCTPSTCLAAGAVAGSCVDTPNCFFGPPLPIANAGLSTCVLNTIGTDAGGHIGKTSGAALLSLPLRSHTFVTGNGSSPCPTCVSGMCTTGARAGMACTPVGTTLVSLDCPPSGAGGSYLPEFSVTLSPLSTGTVTKADGGGIFCAGQGLNPGDAAPGAFGTNPGVASPVAVQIQEVGAPAGNISDMATHASTLASVFCIPGTGNALIDGAASLPGPGAVSLPNTLQLQ